MCKTGLAQAYNRAKIQLKLPVKTYRVVLVSRAQRFTDPVSMKCINVPRSARRRGRAWTRKSDCNCEIERKIGIVELLKTRRPSTTVHNAGHAR